MASTYNPSVPTGRVKLDSDYANVQKNFSQLNITYGTDHYAYDDQTANNGYHNTVTTPAYTNPTSVVKATPPTTGTNPILYGFQPLSADNGSTTTNLGILQYSRGPSNAVPTPVTMLQSQAAAIDLPNTNSTTNVFDFNGMTRAYGKVVAVALTPGFSAVIESDFMYNSATNLVLQSLITSTQFQFVISGTILQIKNLRTGTAPQQDLPGVFWTVQFYRTS